MRLDELRQLVAESFKDTSDVTAIQNAAKINAKIDEIAAEEQELLKKQKELLDSYKEVVLHTSVQPNPNIPNVDHGAGANITLEGFLDNWKKTHKN